MHPQASKAWTPVQLRESTHESTHMSSRHRKTANQLNAGRSTGPRTPEGRAKASRNSRRHGLAVDVFNDPAWTSEVDRLTRIFTQDGTDLDLRQQARLRA